MDKAILVIDMPSCCGECFALDDRSDYPVCLITQEQKGYTFRTREKRMKECPLRFVPEKLEGSNSVYYQWDGYEDGWNHCIDYLIDT